ncbi:DoxX family protein [Streptomyces sp. WMMB 322]|uniref:DoxX family protein n=1 Tax=Streptomyces sp. WMMB 322 TaxID=1286821 RepID=UPI0006E32D70|nr:DoxX family protein [Streptomyces sp. WMMB 322]SCK57032.1 DoxX-like family protein [Streptomyces sp. WMMB 322]
MNQSPGTPSGSPESVPASAQAPAVRHDRVKHISLLVLQVILGLFFVIASAVPKLIAHSSAVGPFEDIGFGLWFMYLVGALELAGGIALATPWLSGLSAISLIGLMIGAFITQLTVFDGEYAATPLLLILPLALIAWGRRDTLTALPGLVRRSGGRGNTAV